MSLSSSPLPDKHQELVDLVYKQASQIEQLQEKVRWFEEQFHLSRHKQFGASSERSVKEQPNLFNEAEAIAEDGPVEEAIRQSITYERKKPGRRPTALRPIGNRFVARRSFQLDDQRKRMVRVDIRTIETEAARTRSSARR